MNGKFICVLLGSALCFLAGQADAYVGPGAGITMLGALWAVIVALAIAIGSILYWPIRALWRKRRQNHQLAPPINEQPSVVEAVKSADKDKSSNDGQPGK